MLANSAKVNSPQAHISKYQVSLGQTPILLSLIVLLPTRSEGRGVFGVGSIPVAILPSSQDMKTFALYLHK